MMNSAGSGPAYGLASSLPRFAEHMEPHEICFQLSKTGRVRQLKQYLNRKTKEDRKRIVSIKHNGATCLIMACRNGCFEVVEYLVEYCAANIEQTGLVNFEGENIEGAPPLWCASAAGHLKIVKYLVSKGANVNSTTKSNSTALRAACFDGHVEIVKFLVENNADIEIANRHGHTCLMIACYKGHFTIAKYLIMKGADLNRKSVKGNTALHDCAECGSLEIMKLLLSHNAKMAPDAYQMTPLLAAAVTGHAAIVEYLLTRPECEPQEKVAALELLGATFVDKKHDMLSAYTYWKAALERRNAVTSYSFADHEKGETVSALSKERTIKHNPIEAYDFATEFMNERDLDEIIADPDDVRMQALLIRERILGPTHPDTTYYIRYRGAVYADCGNFRKCILLWLYALDTQQKSLEPLHPMIQSSFLSFTELFQYMQKQLPQQITPSHHHHHHQRDMLMMGGSGSGGGSDLVTVASSAVSSSLNNMTAAAAAAASSSSSSNANLSMLNMYTSTVLKILQQAVDEIKRGMIMIKQQQQLKNSGGAFSSSSNNSTCSLHAINTYSTNIHQIQRQQLQSSPAYARAVNSNSTSNINKETENEASTSTERKVHSSQATESQQSKDAVAVSASASAADNQTTELDKQLQQQQQVTIETGHFDRTLVVIVHFLCVVADSLRYCSPEETYKLKKLVYALIKLDPRSSAKQSGLIHLASTRDSSSIIKNHTLSSYPSAQVLKLLLECGADPHSLDADKNSPLHLAAANRHFHTSGATSSSSSVAASPPPSAAGSPTSNNAGGGGAASGSSAAGSSTGPSSERDKIILLLLNAGAHLDQCNTFGKTPADLYKNGKLYQVINPINYLSLQCLCAKVIRRHRVPYKDQLTPKLAAFVDIH